MRRSAILVWVGVLFFTGSMSGQVLDLPIWYAMNWTDACEVSFVYANAENPADTVELKMVFRAPHAQDFFWKCGVEGFVPFVNFYHKMERSGGISSHLGYHRHDVLLADSAKSSFWGVRIQGPWYKVTVQSLRKIDSVKIVVHRYALKDQFYEIHYAAPLAILHIQSPMGSYDLVRVNGQRFDLRDAIPILDLPKRRIENRRR